MSELSSDKAFPFSEPIDGRYLTELYAGDYVMIEETFSDVLGEYDTLIGKVCEAHQAEDVATLKSTVHKIKPLFGFVGLLSIQSQCLQFEKACEQGSFSAVAADFIPLRSSLLQAKSIIAAERDRLRAYNDQ